MGEQNTLKTVCLCLAGGGIPPKRKCKPTLFNPCFHDLDSIGQALSLRPLLDAPVAGMVCYSIKHINSRSMGLKHMEDKTEKTEKGQNGGRREGSGRKPKEIEAPKFKKIIRDYLTEPEIIAYIQDLKRRSKKDNRVLIFILEQIFGKAAQQVEMNHTGDLKLEVSIESAIKKVYGGN